MGDDMIDPDWDERVYIVSAEGQKLINEIKSLWVSGVGLDEISSFLGYDPLEITTLLALETLSLHLSEVSNEG